MKQLKNLKIKTKIVMLVYDRNGHHLYEGNPEGIPEHLKDYYVWNVETNKYKTYVFITEDGDWND